jgi:DNA-directed primase/polymerase protein
MEVARFYKLQLAKDYAGKEKRIFSYELPSRSGIYNGSRSFLVCDWPTIFKIIEEKPIQDRCYYEIIDENSHCRLYIDLEFSKLENPQINGDAMTQELITLLCFHLSKLTPVSDKDVLVLDSTTQEKYSVHLIFNLKLHIFQNNSVCGHFLRSITSLNEYGPFIVRKDGGKISYMDLSVYRKSASFRLIYNSKRGKQSYLNVSNIDNSVREAKLCKKAIFLRSLISKPYKGTKEIITSNDIFRIFGSSINATSSNLLRTFIGPREDNKQGRL